MSMTNKENINENQRELNENAIKISNDKINHALRESPYRKKIAHKQLDQIEVTQKLLKDFGIIFYFT